jgi:hypothetical protein
MATVTLYPNANGDVMDWNAEGGDYSRVNETGSHDGDDSRLYTPTDNNKALFNLDNPSVTGSIYNVQVNIVIRGLDPIDQGTRVGLKTDGTEYWSSTKSWNSQSYITLSEDWAENPDTEDPWTWSEINSLQVGMQKISGGGMAVTQIYVVVTYATAELEQHSFRFRNDDGSETTATWAANLNTNHTIPAGENKRLRFLVNTESGTPGASVFVLQYKEKVSGTWANVPEDTTIYSDNVVGGGTATASLSTPGGEEPSKAFDGSSSTKFLGLNGSVPEWLKYQFPSSNTYKVTKYAITSANDDDTRDPKDWELQGSNDDSNWTTVDTVSGETFASRGLRKEFICDSPSSTAFEYYRLYVTANNGATGTYYLQLAELEFYETVVHPFKIAASTNITDGASTTAQLTAPSGKTTSDFDAGKIFDENNPTSSITIGEDKYTEIEFNIEASEDLDDDDVYQLRLVLDPSIVLDTYTQTPEWEVGAEAGGGGVVLSTLTLLGVG